MPDNHASNALIQRLFLQACTSRWQ